jgi:diguanylate cyclase (GGDEF)-like protein
MKKTLIITDKGNIISGEYRKKFRHIRSEFLDSESFSVDKVIREDPSIIIIDITSKKEMKNMGLLLKNDFSSAYIPVITFLSRDDLSDRVPALVKDFDDYMLRPVDPVELKVRIDMAIKRSRHRFYANPLTGLPGGIVIEETLREKLKGKETFVTGHIDIDNFKSFNDKYGYLKGDRVIMQTAYMLNISIRTWGNKTDFLGHIGGDDFVVITTPEKYNDVFRNFICMFDTIIPFHYSANDRENGYIKIRDRMKILREIPLMSVTVAMIIKNSSFDLNSLIEVNDRIAEVKQYLKKISGSKYMADRRMVQKDDSLSLQVFNSYDEVRKSYRPLGQLLVESNVITPEDLDRALKEHWRRGVLLGEVMKELKLINNEQLETALKVQAEELWSAEGDK